MKQITDDLSFFCSIKRSVYLTFHMWNELTILWYDLTVDWNDTTMERNDRKSWMICVEFVDGLIILKSIIKTIARYLSVSKERLRCKLFKLLIGETIVIRMKDNDNSFLP